MEMSATQKKSSHRIDRKYCSSRCLILKCAEWQILMSLKKTPFLTIFAFVACVEHQSWQTRLHRRLKKQPGKLRWWWARCTTRGTSGACLSAIICVLANNDSACTGWKLRTSWPPPSFSPGPLLVPSSDWVTNRSPWGLQNTALQNQTMYMDRVRSTSIH